MRESFGFKRIVKGKYFTLYYVFEEHDPDNVYDMKNDVKKYLKSLGAKYVSFLRSKKYPNKYGCYCYPVTQKLIPVIVHNQQQRLNNEISINHTQ